MTSPGTREVEAPGGVFFYESGGPVRPSRLASPSDRPSTLGSGTQSFLKCPSEVIFNAHRNLRSLSESALMQKDGNV